MFRKVLWQCFLLFSVLEVEGGQFKRALHSLLQHVTASTILILLCHKKLEVDFNIGQVIPPLKPTIHKLISVALLVLWIDWHVMPLCWQEPKCLPYLDCSITLSFISQFNPNANDTFTILYISQFSVAFLPLKTKYDFKGQCADRHHWKNHI